MMNERFNHTRRSFVRTGACVLCVGALGTILSSCDSVQEGDPVFDLKKEEQLRNIGGAVKKRFAAINNGESVFVIHAGERKYLAYAAQCTHQWVELTMPVDGIIKCPNHGSRFRATDGSVIDGKAYEPLKQFAVEYDEDAQLLRILPPPTDPL